MKKFITNNPEFILTAIIALVICFCCKTGKSQSFYKESETTHYGVFGTIGAGRSVPGFAVEVNAGFRYKYASLSIGHVAIKANDQPTMFNITAGYNITNSIRLSGGIVKLSYNYDDTRRNYYTYTAGAQYHFYHFDRGTFYGGLYYTPGFTSLLIGMSYNLMHKPNQQ